MYLYGMKKGIVYIVLMLISFFGYTKKVDSTLLVDKLSFDYINIYREYHGESKIKWSDDLYKISVSHTDKLIVTNKEKYPNGKGMYLFHSKTNNFENCMASGFGKIMGRTDFDSFIKTYFNKDEKDLSKEEYKALLPIWSWNGSEPHKKNLLNPNHTVGSTHVGVLNTHTEFKSGNSVFKYDWVRLFSTSNFK